MDDVIVLADGRFVSQDKLPVGFVVLNQSRALHANSRALHFFNASGVAALNERAPDKMLVSPRPRRARAILRWLLQRAQHNRELKGEIQVLQRDGTHARCFVWTTCLRIGAERALGVFMDENIAPNRRQAAERAAADPVTGLPGRHVFLDRLGAHLARRSGAFERSVRDTTSIICVDLEGFSRINDAFGFAVGDAALAKFSARLRSLAPEGAEVARIAGDRFALFIDARQPDDDQRLLAILEDSLRLAPFDAGGTRVHLSVNCGIARFPEHGGDPQSLLSCAEFALLQARQESEAVRIFSYDSRPSARDDLDLIPDLHTAVNDRQFFLHYQPQVSVGDGELFGAEALIRWNHPRRGVVYPDLFIAATEKLGLSARIGEWSLYRATRFAAEAAQRWKRRFQINVNVTPRQLLDVNFVTVLQRALALASLPADMLALEIVEWALLKETSRMQRTLDAVAELGVKLYVDDFGIGHAGFAYLGRYPISGVKIDRSFLAEYDRQRNIVRALAAFADDLNLAVTVEGVETESQLQFVRQLPGRVACQGYYFAPGLAPRQFRQFAEASVKPTLTPANGNG